MSHSLRLCVCSLSMCGSIWRPLLAWGRPWCTAGGSLTSEVYKLAPIFVWCQYFSVNLGCFFTIQCRRWAVGDICHLVVANAAVYARDPAEHQSCCGRPAAPSNVHGSDSCGSMLSSSALVESSHISKMNEFSMTRCRSPAQLCVPRINIY